MSLESQTLKADTVLFCIFVFLLAPHPQGVSKAAAVKSRKRKASGDLADKAVSDTSDSEDADSAAVAAAEDIGVDTDQVGAPICSWSFSACRVHTPRGDYSVTQKELSL